MPLNCLFLLHESYQQHLVALLNAICSYSCKLGKNKAGNRFPLKKVKPGLKHIRSPSQDLLLSCHTSKIQFLSPELQDVRGILSREPEFVIHPLPAASSIRLCTEVLGRHSLQSVPRENYAIVSINVYDPWVKSNSEVESLLLLLKKRTINTIQMRKFSLTPGNASADIQDFP